jgi:hypothetical protein
MKHILHKRELTVMNTKRRLTALVVASATAALFVPAQSADAWVAYGSRWGCRPIVVAHPAPCYAGVGAAAVGGFLAGAAVASAARPAVVVNPAPVVINQAPVYVGSPMIGTTVSVLPPGCSTMDVNGTHYYQLGSTWYRPYFGGSGVYYQVVAAP